jgi:virginiamycin B lyase
MAVAQGAWQGAAVSLAQFVSARPGWRWGRWPGLVIAACIVTAAITLAGRIGPWGSRGFTELRLPSRTDIPVAIAVAPDRTVWFTLESSDTIGLLRNGKVQKLPTGSASVEPLGLAVDPSGLVWYTDAAARKISGVSPEGSITSFALSTPVARLGRLAVAPDGAVWFAEPSLVSVTRLKDEVFTRHLVGPTMAMGSSNVAPFGVAIAADGAVWATLQNANKLVRITPGRDVVEFEVPTRRSGLGDIGVDATGAVSFLEISANKIGRLAGGRFEEFPVPTPGAGLTALAVAPDGAVWFTELRAHKLGRLRDGVITEFPLPRRDARPFGIAVDTGNNVWYTDLSGWLGRLDAEWARGR